MLDWLKPRRGRRTLEQRLATYPPYRTPFPGRGTALTEEQAAANLAYLYAQRADRLRFLSALLAEDGLDLSAAFAGSDPAPLLDDLWRWSLANWPPLSAKLADAIRRWPATTRADDEIAFAMLFDIALALGEIVIVRRPDYRWDLDRDPQSEADDMISWRRAVLLRPADALVRVDIMYDFEDTVVASFAASAKPSSYAVVNDLARGVMDILSGAAEAAFLA